jgi:hypothetical protein
VKKRESMRVKWRENVCEVERVYIKDRVKERE